MKIVINQCFGGFGLSHQAVMEYGRRKGTPLYAFVNNGTSFKTVSDEDADKAYLVHYCTSNHATNSDELNKSYFSPSDIIRTDPDLIAIVEEMGPAASGRHAELKIVDIPDGTDWELDDYDGIETIHEKHRSWS